MSYRSNIEEIEVVKHAETQKAVLVSVDGDDDNAVWLPKSLIEIDHVKGSVYKISAEMRLLQDKGLI